MLPAAVPLPALADGIDTVFVAGSTGQTGRRVVQQLRAQGYKVRAGIRDEKKAQGLGFSFDKGVELVKADVVKDAASLKQAIGDAQAVIIATGGFGDTNDKGTINLVDAAKAAGGVQHIVLVSSLLTNAPAVGQAGNGNYKFLNLFGKVLDRKLVAEQYVRASGIPYTIVRPGGLSNDPPEQVGNLVVSGEDTLFGLPSDPGRAISRDTVAEVCVAALRQPSANDKVVEIVASPSAPVLSDPAQWFM